MKIKNDENVIQYAPFEKLRATLRVNPENRVTDKSQAHIKRLAKSMAKDGYLKAFPIHVDSTGMILGGHHRFAAALEAQVGVFYQVCPGGMAEFIKITRATSDSKPWSTKDWIELYSRDNTKSDYAEVKAFITRYDKFGSKLVLAILLGRANHVQQSIYESVIQGDFKIKVNTAQAMMLAEQLVQVYDALADNVKTGKVSLAFGFAVLHMMKHPDYNHRSFVQKLKETKFTPMSRREWNIERLQEIYNKGMKKNHINFLEAFKKEAKNAAA